MPASSRRPTERSHEVEKLVFPSTTPARRRRLRRYLRTNLSERSAFWCRGTSSRAPSPGLSNPRTPYEKRYAVRGNVIEFSSAPLIPDPRRSSLGGCSARESGFIMIIKKKKVTKPYLIDHPTASRECRRRSVEDVSYSPPPRVHSKKKKSARPHQHQPFTCAEDRFSTFFSLVFFFCFHSCEPRSGLSRKMRA